MPDPRPVTLISVDIEAAGPSPSDYAMLSIGACLVDDPEQAFYIELQPDRETVDDAAMSIGGFTLDGLRASGTPPREAMTAFAEWIEAVTPRQSRPLLVGFNAPFDWMFVADYFHRYLGRNPLGHAALDVKAYYAGVTGVPWGETSLHRVAEHYRLEMVLTHNALDDARDQATLFRAIRAEQQERSAGA
ncbi:3'-5' exonuclease [Chryseoglobus sp. 28M-23]|uniref:3'-5' exonuclease n=1 Tax=Chryseoglobus sp. 28M-23 TaxID=2772253 RepID=UPI00174750BC|nr:3'-5' exonuclease [Chryseoglobus sp. 28M-23]QOD94379.1 3'-5' exonuclease [Chryseoglobus sp. 28M-23]